MGDEKASGPDGYNVYFFKHSWGLVGGDIMELVRGFFEKVELPPYVNSFILTLIPKKTNAADIKDYPPIPFFSLVILY
ncbi:Transposon TX1 uncharacterized 149 kDa protein [Linum perenne]